MSGPTKAQREATRDPLPPPFPVGARIRYEGTRRSYHDREMTIPIIAPGVEYVVQEVRDGIRGTGRVVDHDDEGEAILDRTCDGVSVFTSPRGMRLAVNARSAGEWRITAKGRAALDGGHHEP